MVPKRSKGVVIGLSAVIVAVTEEVPRILTLRRVGHALATPAQKGNATAWPDSPDGLPSGPFDAEGHRTLDSGLRFWVKEQTNLDLGYVEQLYTFGDRYRDPRELAGGPRVISIGYLALVRQAPISGTAGAEWRNWYAYLPWEDWRAGPPRVVHEAILPGLNAWAAVPRDRENRELRKERIAVAFGNGGRWNMERVLDRYELLYEAGLLFETLRDKQVHAAYTGERSRPVSSQKLALTKALGQAMALDNRRILATALGRLRGKLRYRPVIFDLVPESFTLLRLQRVVEALAGIRLHKQNFRRLVVGEGLVEPTGHRETPRSGRPAELFRFRRDVLSERHAPGVGLPSLRLAR